MLHLAKSLTFWYFSKNQIILSMLRGFQFETLIAIYLQQLNFVTACFHPLADPEGGGFQGLEPPFFLENFLKWRENCGKLDQNCPFLCWNTPFFTRTPIFKLSGSVPVICYRLFCTHVEIDNFWTKLKFLIGTK